MSLNPELENIKKEIENVYQYNCLTNKICYKEETLNKNKQLQYGKALKNMYKSDFPCKLDFYQFQNKNYSDLVKEYSKEGYLIFIF